MSRVRAPGDDELDAKAREALARARIELAGVPGPLRALAAAPRALGGAWGATESILLDGRVPRTTKLLVALAASGVSNGAQALAQAFRRALEAQGMDAAILDELEKKGETARLPERTQRVLVFARRAALQPAMLTDEDFKVLRRDGMKDDELAELVALGALIAFWIAIARALPGA